MDRLTERNDKKIDSYYMKCGKDCCRTVFSCEYCQEFEKVVDRLGTIEDILGEEYDLNHLRELVQADKDSRYAIFPCKPSDVTVYQLRNKKHALGVGVSPCHVYCATVWSGGHYQLEHQGFDPCRDRDFGKTWFLDEESANAALKGEKDHGL